MRTEKRFTHVAKVPVAFRVSPHERELLYEAAKFRGISQSEMARESIREHAGRIVAAARRA